MIVDIRFIFNLLSDMQPPTTRKYSILTKSVDTSFSMTVSCCFFEFPRKCFHTISHRVSEPETFKAKATMSTTEVEVVTRGSSGRGDDLPPTAPLGTEEPLLLSDHPTKNHLHENVSVNC